MSGVVEEGREEIAAAIAGLIDGVFIQWLLDPERVDPTSVFEVLLAKVEALAKSSPSGPPNDVRRA